MSCRLRIRAYYHPGVDPWWHVRSPPYPVPVEGFKKSHQGVPKPPRQLPIAIRLDLSAYDGSY